MRKLQIIVIAILSLLCVSPALMQNELQPITKENLDELEEVYTLEGHLGPVNSIAFSPEHDVLASVGDDTTLRLWMMSDGRQTSETYEHFSFVKDVVFHPEDETILATASWDQSVLIWDISGERPAVIQQIQGANAVIEDVAFSPDGQYVAFGVGNGEVRLFETGTDEIVQRFALDALQVTDVAFDPDGESLIAAGGFPDDTASLWDIESGELITRLTGHLGSVTSTAFSPDGDLIATGGDDGTVRFWRDGEEVLVLVQDDWVVDIAFNADATLLVVALQNGSLLIWDVEEAELLTTLDAHEGLVNAIAFNPSSTLLASAGDDGVIKVWGLLP